MNLAQIPASFCLFFKKNNTSLADHFAETGGGVGFRSFQGWKSTLKLPKTGTKHMIRWTLFAVLPLSLWMRQSGH